MGEEIAVQHLGADRFMIDIRGHRLVVDQHTDAMHVEAGPTPTELLVAALASCTAHFARRVLGRDDPDATVSVACNHRMSTAAPHRVEWVEMHVTVPAGLSAQRRASVERAMQHCTVHESLRSAPRVVIDLVPDPALPTATPARAGSARA